MISICITIKDRSVVASEGEKLRLFPACLKAIRDCIAEISTCEVVISDWGSTDWPLEQWVRDVLEPINVKLVPLTGNFSRGQGLNASAAAAVGDVFMFLDADCLIRSDFISAAEDVPSSNTAFFPIVYAYHTRHHSTGGWRYEGFGNCVVTRQMFDSAGPWPEFQHWGREDNEFFLKIADSYKIKRIETESIVHQWHPEPFTVDERRMSERWFQSCRRMLHDLWTTVPPGAKTTLLDEGALATQPYSFNRRVSQLRCVRGLYQGLPSSEDALLEEIWDALNDTDYFVIFNWCDWWLDHYTSLRGLLAQMFTLVEKTESFSLYKKKITADTS